MTSEEKPEIRFRTAKEFCEEFDGANVFDHIVHQLQTPYNGPPPCAEESCNHMEWQHNQEGYCTHCETICLDEPQYSYKKVTNQIK